MQVKDYAQYLKKLIYGLLVSYFSLLGYHQICQAFALQTLNQHIQEHQHALHLHDYPHGNPMQTHLHLHHSEPSQNSQHPEQVISEGPELFLPWVLLLVWVGLSLCLWCVTYFETHGFYTDWMTFKAYWPRPPPFSSSRSLIQLKSIILLH